MNVKRIIKKEFSKELEFNNDGHFLRSNRPRKAWYIVFVIHSFMHSHFHLFVQKYSLIYLLPIPYVVIVVVGCGIDISAYI